MKADDRSYLRQLADELDNAPRSGGITDEPEGARFIIISDTWARQIAEKLRGIAVNE